MMTELMTNNHCKAIWCHFRTASQTAIHIDNPVVTALLCARIHRCVGPKIIRCETRTACRNDGPVQFHDVVDDGVELLLAHICKRIDVVLKMQTVWRKYGAVRAMCKKSSGNHASRNAPLTPSCCILNAAPSPLRCHHLVILLGCLCTSQDDNLASWSTVCDVSVTHIQSLTIR